MDIEARLNKLSFKQRHNRKCRKDKEIGEWHAWPKGKQKCYCPWSALGVLDPEKGFRPHATGKTNYDDARAQVRQWLRTGKIGVNEDPHSTLVKTAIDDYMSSVKEGGAEPSTITKYETIMDHFEAFAEWKGISTVQRFDQDAMLEFRRSWSDPKHPYKAARPRWRSWTDATAKRAAKTMRYFFQRCIARKFIAENPTAILTFPKDKLSKSKESVKYLTPDQMTDIIWAVDQFPKMRAENKLRLKALILTMRWAGLRISDAVVLKKEHFQKDVLLKITQKSKTPVRVPIPPEAMETIAALEPCEDGFIFWNRRESERSERTKTPIDNFSTNVRQVLEKAGVRVKGVKDPNGLNHRFRNTFAVDLLEKGVPLETVSLMLGHASVTTTERYYAAFTGDYMVRAEETVRATFKPPSA
jgi:integrase/recombinase XerD